MVRAAVIGSGFGGLATAIRLQAAGVETTVLEACDQPGGRAQVYHERGFTFDAGPTVITAPHAFEELFALAGRAMRDAVELVPVRPFYRLVWHDGDTLDYDGEHMVETVRRRSPGDVDGYLRFVEHTRRVFEKGYRELGSTPFLRFSDMLRVAPELARMRADRSVYETVARYVRDARIRQALSFHSLLVGGNPFETSSIYTLIHYLERHWGVFFPRGGTHALVHALVRLLEGLGGELQLEAPVRRAAVSHRGDRTEHRLTTNAHDYGPFDLVVSNADVHGTYAELYRDVPGADAMRRHLEGLEWSMSLFVLYFGTDVRYDRHIVHHTILFGPRYRDLIADIFGGTRLPEDFSLYLHAPTVTDPSLAPAGCSSFYVLSPVPHLGNAPLDWDALAPAYADRILEALERVLPDLRRHVVVRRWLHPGHFRRRLGARFGSAFSCSPRLLQSAWFRPHNRDPRIPGLYLAGAGTHPGAGLPGVVASAKATASVIARDFGLEVPA